MPHAREERIPATDGHPLAATVHEPSVPPVATVVLGSATAVRRGFYAPFAAFLATKGLRTVAFDYRGIGDTPDVAGSTMSDWGARDLGGAIAHAAKGALPVLVVGHSAGGQLLGMAPDAPRVRALLGIASQSGYWKHWGPIARWRFAGLWYAAVPATTAAFGRVPRWAGLGADLPAGVAREWARWCRHPDYVLGEGGEARRAAYGRFAGDVLAWSFEDDSYAPAAAVDALLRFYPSARGARRHVPRSEAGRAVGHFGFFRPAFAATLWEEAAAWLVARARG